MKLLVTIAFAAMASQAVYANCETASGSFRKCYDNSNAPPALVYRIFVRHIFYGSLEDEEDQFGSHYVEAGLTPKMSPDNVLYYFASTYIDIENEVEEAQKRTFCLDGKPRYDGSENFIIFNQLEEVSLSIYEKHRLFARSDLMANGRFDLDKALEEFPGSFTDMFMDHEKAHKGSVQRINEAAMGLCENPWGHQFSSSQSELDDHPKIKVLEAE